MPAEQDRDVANGHHLLATRTETFVGSSYCLLVSIPVAGFCAARLRALGFCLAFLALPGCFAQQPKAAPGSIAGEVFNIGADGQRAVVPGAHINLSPLLKTDSALFAAGRKPYLVAGASDQMVQDGTSTFRGKVTTPIRPDTRTRRHQVIRMDATSRARNERPTP